MEGQVEECPQVSLVVCFAEEAEVGHIVLALAQSHACDLDRRMRHALRWLVYIQRDLVLGVRTCVRAVVRERQASVEGT